MHPIFRNTTSLGAYLALWTVLAAMLAALIRVPSDLGWSQALSVAVPLCMFYAFVCLTPWYLCRAFPLGSPRVARLIVNQLGINKFHAAPDGQTWSRRSTANIRCNPTVTALTAS